MVSEFTGFHGLILKKHNAPLFDYNGILSPNQLMENFWLYFYIHTYTIKTVVYKWQPTPFHINQFLCYIQAQIQMEKHQSKCHRKDNQLSQEKFH